MSVDTVDRKILCWETRKVDIRQQRLFDIFVHGCLVLKSYMTAEYKPETSLALVKNAALF